MRSHVYMVTRLLALFSLDCFLDLDFTVQTAFSIYPFYLCSFFFFLRNICALSILVFPSVRLRSVFRDRVFFVFLFVNFAMTETHVNDFLIC